MNNSNKKYNEKKTTIKKYAKKQDSLILNDFQLKSLLRRRMTMPFNRPQT